MPHAYSDSAAPKGWQDRADKNPSILDYKFKGTFFRNRAGQAADTHRGTYTLRSVAKAARTVEKDSKAQLPCILPATFGEHATDKGCLRNSANLLTITGVMIDYDAGQISPEEAEARVKAANVGGLIYTTPSHRPEHPKWRGVFPASAEMPPEARDALWARLNGLFEGKLDPASFVRVQYFYIGSVVDPVGDLPPIEVRLVEGRFLDHASELAEVYPEGRERAANDNGGAEGRLGWPIETIREAVMAVPNTGKYDDRSEWLRFLAALHHETEGSDGGRAIAHEWSRLHASYDSDATDAAWDSFRVDRPGGVTFWMIIHEAEANGWQRPREDFSEKFEDLSGGAEAPDSEDPTSPNYKTPRDALNFVCAGDVNPESVEWVWPGHLARGKLTMVAGDPGMGKSQISIDMGARCTRGNPWPDDGDAPLGSVVILSAEDAVNDTISPRLIAAEADRRRVHILKSVTDKKGALRSFSLQADLDALGEKVTALGDVVLVIIDPITSYMGATIDSHRTTDVRAVLGPVAEWAERLNVAVLAVSHPPKAAQAKAINAVTGSLAFVAAARMVFLAIEEPETQRLVLLPVKNNLGPKAAGLGYKIASYEIPRGIHTSRIEWDGMPVNVTADEALRTGRADKPTAVNEAMEFLQGFLGFEEKPVDEVTAAAKAEGFSQSTLRRAKAKLEIVARKGNFDGGWLWRLPE